MSAPAQQIFRRAAYTWRRRNQRFCWQRRGNEADKAVEFLSSPLSRSYVFNYNRGGKLLDALFAVRGNVDFWFTRLLTEPVTPSQIRAWTAN